MGSAGEQSHHRWSHCATLRQKDLELGKGADSLRLESASASTLSGDQTRHLRIRETQGPLVSVRFEASNGGKIKKKSFPSEGRLTFPNPRRTMCVFAFIYLRGSRFMCRMWWFLRGADWMRWDVCGVNRVPLLYVTQQLSQWMTGWTNPINDTIIDCEELWGKHTLLYSCRHSPLFLLFFTINVGVCGNIRENIFDFEYFVHILCVFNA